jgi:hypothetical protein
LAKALEEAEEDSEEEKAEELGVSGCLRSLSKETIGRNHGFFMAFPYRKLFVDQRVLPFVISIEIPKVKSNYL